MIVPLIVLGVLGLGVLASKSSSSTPSTRVGASTIRDRVWDVFSKAVLHNTSVHDMSGASYLATWNRIWGEGAWINAGGIESLIRDMGECPFGGHVFPGHRNPCLDAALATLDAMNRDLGLPADNGWMTFEQFWRWMGKTPLAPAAAPPAPPQLLLARPPAPTPYLLARPPVPVAPGSPSRFAPASFTAFNFARR